MGDEPKAGLTMRDLAARHGLEPVTVLNWIKLERLKPVATAVTPNGRTCHLFDPAAFARVVADRTPPPGWKTTAEVAAEVGVSRNYLCDLYAWGAIAGRKVNGLIRLDPESVAAWVRAGRPSRAAGYDRSAPNGGPGRGRPVRRRATDDDLDDERTPEGGDVPPGHRRRLVEFGGARLKLYQSDLDFLARVRERFPRKDGRDGR